MCDCEHEEPYRPNKYTRYMTLDMWRAINRGGVAKGELIDPGYVNEPHEEPRK